MVPYNSVRVRALRVTTSTVPKLEEKGFDQTVTWTGYGEVFEYEIQGRAPILHRRVVFSSAEDWGFQSVRCDAVYPQGNVWARFGADSLADDVVCRELRRMFGESADVRTLFYGKVVAKGVTVVDDSRKMLEGKELGSLQEEKHWTSFRGRKSATVKFDVDNEEVMTSIVDGCGGEHFYVVDVFQHGIGTMDMKIPSPMSSSKKRGSEDSDAPAPKKKKVDSAIDQSMSGMALNEMPDVFDGDAQHGLMRITAKARLYWKEIR